MATTREIRQRIRFVRNVAQIMRAVESCCWLHSMFLLVA